MGLGPPELATTNSHFNEAQGEIVELRTQTNEYEAPIDALPRQLATAESCLIQTCKAPPLDNVTARMLAKGLRFRVRRRLTRALRASAA